MFFIFKIRSTNISMRNVKNSKPYRREFFGPVKFHFQDSEQIFRNIFKTDHKKGMTWFWKKSTAPVIFKFQTHVGRRLEAGQDSRLNFILFLSMRFIVYSVCCERLKSLIYLLVMVTVYCTLYIILFGVSF